MRIKTPYSITMDVYKELRFQMIQDFKPTQFTFGPKNCRVPVQLNDITTDGKTTFQYEIVFYENTFTETLVNDMTIIENQTTIDSQNKEKYEIFKQKMLDTLGFLFVYKLKNQEEVEAIRSLINKDEKNGIYMEDSELYFAPGHSHTIYKFQYLNHLFFLPVLAETIEKNRLHLLLGTF